MSKNSKIEWTDHTFNPWEGCQKVGPGCDHCYAEARNARFGGGVAVNWGPGAPRRRTSPANWRKPLAWNAVHREFFEAHGRRQRVFCASLADVFDNAVDPVWRRDLFDLIELTPNLNWLLLTKRIGNVFDMVARARAHDWLAGRDNVWLGATVVNQDEADRDIPKLLDVPARIRFLSIEPMLDTVDVQAAVKRVCRQCKGMGIVQMSDDGGYWTDCACERASGLHWVICGGESGQIARPMHPDWARTLRDQCKSGGVSFLFKQWGEWAPAPEVITASGPLFHRFDDGTWMQRIGKKAAGRQLDGRTHDEFPRGAA
ncbi:protein gp37 [Paraburkholderia sp. BL23I1N1]|uniref:phage Gp37/Gp68 family protein n=1 Tax=Paraburkholderia sp. BL23I1N1 TaxID=1938802 RepID=UPI000E74D876|nr:phage Gp37/Gp68 family protein [Paraburkholderia sp. BL23I1N1]RKE35236.1 protein gp37 [Paraburkholderia sp. BL23I1N1]